MKSVPPKPENIQAPLSDLTVLADHIQLIANDTRPGTDIVELNAYFLRRISEQIRGAVRHIEAVTNAR